MTTRICHNCGKNYNDHVEYCPYCHTVNVHYQKPQETVKNEPRKGIEVLLCHKCGKAYDNIIEYCPYCHTLNIHYQKPQEKVKKEPLKGRETLKGRDYCICHNCGKNYHYHAQFCPYCRSENRNYQKTQQTMKPKPAPVTAIEYRRTCSRCGTVWHSLIQRETLLNKQSTCYSVTVCFDMCNPAAASQDLRNRDAQQNELVRLRQCPKCGSMVFYQEEIGID